ncbi:maleylpyruvate isomerase N-terminal domain-containing protein [Mycolicibacterium baixiangningiae]|uniref:maleylpyruvate isomerase N-terminal domain-containing protein n=1 Tax=Mycolicibacterium baixiangningiae TaxID=2761578 RepID=UPI0018D0E1E3|nr:maleylpyruvate isomerase N-terminal domain-containing protein [Mycolicibacterium baixiangningiae]
MSTVFDSAANSFVELVGKVPAAALDGPGLGEWDLRALVGHTSRSLITVSTYLQTTAEREDVTSAADYYLRVTPAALGIDPAAVAERGRQAGRDLGEDPAATVTTLAARALADVDAAGDPLIVVIGGLGIRLRTYLPTRTFELAVHGMDIARAAGVDWAPPPAVLSDALRLAADVAVASGAGAEVLLALTGRAALPPSFSIV